MRRLSGLFILLSFLTGCGPKVTVCVSNPKSKNFVCYNESQSKHLYSAPQKVDNWIFTSAADQRSYLTACANHLGGVKISVCVFSSRSLSFACFNEVTGQSFGMTLDQSENWVGVSPVDQEIILDFCLSKKK